MNYWRGVYEDVREHPYIHMTWLVVGFAVVESIKLWWLR